MKNQNDLIISIVAIVLALIIAGVCFGTKREPATIPAPEKVNLAPPVLPQGDVVMTSALPGGAGGGGGGGIGAPGIGASSGGGRGSAGVAMPGVPKSGIPSASGAK